MIGNLEMIKLSRAIDSQFCPRAPEGKAYLPFQKAGIEYALKVKHVLLGDEPGLGKTIQAIGIANELNAKNILIICPASLQANWFREWEAWQTCQSNIEYFHPRKNLSKQNRVLIASYHWAGKPESVKELKNLGPFDLLIFDECHYLKNEKANRTKYSLAKNGLVGSALKVIAISGTSIVNRPIEIYPITKVLAGHLIGNTTRFGFGVKYCAGWQTPWGSWDFNGASNLKELGIKLRSGFLVRRKKEEVLKELPDKFINVVYCEENSSGKKVISQMASYDTPGKLSNIDVLFEELSSLRRELGVSKMDFVYDYVLTQLEAGHKKIILFAYHKEVIEAFCDLFDRDKIKYSRVVGGMTKEDKDKNVQSFQNDPEVNIFIGSSAAYEGLTLTASSYVIFAEFSWVPGQNDQAMDRAHRIGQKNNVMVDFIVYKNSLDEKILKFVLEKSKNIKDFYS